MLHKIGKNSHWLVPSHRSLGKVRTRGPCLLNFWLWDSLVHNFCPNRMNQSTFLSIVTVNFTLDGSISSAFEDCTFFFHLVFVSLIVRIDFSRDGGFSKVGFTLQYLVILATHPPNAKHKKFWKDSFLFHQLNLIMQDSAQIIRSDWMPIDWG